MFKSIHEYHVYMNLYVRIRAFKHVPIFEDVCIHIGHNVPTVFTHTWYCVYTLTLHYTCWRMSNLLRA